MASLNDTIDQGQDPDVDTDVTQPQKKVVPVPDTLANRVGYVQQYEDLLKDPQYTQHAPTTDRQSLQQAIDAAKDTYNKQKNTNEWLDVAQMLGRAGTQFAASKAGKANNVDMSNLNFGPGIDYNARTNRNFDEYKSAIGTAQDLDRADRQNVLENNAVKQSEFQRKSGMLEKAADREERNSEANLRDKAVDRRLDTSEAGQNKRAAAAAAAQAAENERLRNQIHARSLESDIKDTKRDLQDSAAAIPAMAEEISGDESPKELAAFRNKHARELGSLDPQDIADAQKQATAPGRFFGTNFDKDKFQQALSDKVRQKKGAELTNLRQALDKLTSGSPPTPATPVAQTPQGKSMTTVDLQKYADLHKISTGDAQKYLESQGYSIK